MHVFPRKQPVSQLLTRIDGIAPETSTAGPAIPQAAICSDVFSYRHIHCIIHVVNSFQLQRIVACIEFPKKSHTHNMRRGCVEEDLFFQPTQPVKQQWFHRDLFGTYVIREGHNLNVPFLGLEQNRYITAHFLWQFYRFDHNQVLTRMMFHTKDASTASRKSHHVTTIFFGTMTSTL